jgi:MipA family protein
MLLRLFKISFTTSSMMCASASFAQEDDSDTTQNDNHVILGIGTTVQKLPFRGDGTQILPVPIISIKQDNFYVEFSEVGLQFAPKMEGNFQPSISGFIAARGLSGRDRYKLTADAGIRAGVVTPAGLFSAEYRHDITGKFDGSEIVGRYIAPISLGKFTITPSAHVSLLDRNTANYMYGVTPKQRNKMIAKGRDTIQPLYVVTEKAINFGGDIRWPGN